MSINRQPLLQNQNDPNQTTVISQSGLSASHSQSSDFDADAAVDIDEKSSTNYVAMDQAQVQVRNENDAREYAHTSAKIIPSHLMSPDTRKVRRQQISNDHNNRGEEPIAGRGRGRGHGQQQQQVIVSANGSSSSARSGYYADDDGGNNGGSESSHGWQWLLKRNWLFIVFMALLGFDVGFIVFIFTGYVYVVIFGVVCGLFIGVVIDEFKFGTGRVRRSGSKITVEADVDVEKRFQMEEGCDFYVQTDLYSRFLRKYRGSTRVYHKKNNGTLTFQRKFVFTFKEYKGYEIGAGWTSFVAFAGDLIVDVILFFVKYDQVTVGYVILFLCLLIFVTICGFFLGYLVESWLRAGQLISPINGSKTVTKTVPIHEIRDVICICTGYYVRSENDVRKELRLARFGIFFYRIEMALYTVFMYGLLLLRINFAFILWMLVTVFLTFLFVVDINKESKSLLEVTMVGAWIVCALNIIFVLFLSPFIQKVDIGTRFSLPKISVDRIDAPTQLKFFCLLLGSCICLLIAALLISVVVEESYHSGKNQFKKRTRIPSHRMICHGNEFTYNMPLNFTGAVNEYAYDYDYGYGSTGAYAGIKQMSFDDSMSKMDGADAVDDDGGQTIKGPRRKRRLFGVDADADADVVGAFGANAKFERQLCKSPHKQLLIAAVVAMCIAWNLLLVVSFWWFSVDNYALVLKAQAIERAPRKRRAWRKYTVVYITRARSHKWQLFAPVVAIELDEEKALQLQAYLTQICPYTQLPSTIGLSYDGGFQYVNRFGDIGGQAFGNNNKNNHNIDDNGHRDQY